MAVVFIANLPHTEKRMLLTKNACQNTPLIFVDSRQATKSNCPQIQTGTSHENKTKHCCDLGIRLLGPLYAFPYRLLPECPTYEPRSGTPSHVASTDTEAAVRPE